MRSRNHILDLSLTGFDPKLLRARLRSQRSISVECDDQRRLPPHYVLVVLAVKQRYYYRSSFFAA
jgi:hypothetical protein